MTKNSRSFCSSNKTFLSFNYPSFSFTECRAVFVGLSIYSKRSAFKVWRMLLHCCIAKMQFPKSIWVCLKSILKSEGSTSKWIGWQKWCAILQFYSSWKSYKCLWQSLLIATGLTANLKIGLRKKYRLEQIFRNFRFQIGSQVIQNTFTSWNFTNSDVWAVFEQFVWKGIMQLNAKFIQAYSCANVP